MRVEGAAVVFGGAEAVAAGVSWGERGGGRGRGEGEGGEEECEACWGGGEVESREGFLGGYPRTGWGGVGWFGFCCARGG